MRIVTSLGLVFVALGASCGSPPATPAPVTAPAATVAVPKADGDLAASPVVPVAAPAAQTRKVDLPDSVRGRSVGAATSLIGGDANGIDVLFGQFEHPEEAIVRFDRKTGCAYDAIGPWPTLTKVVRGRVSYDVPKMSHAETLEAVHSADFKKELAAIVAIYTQRGRRGEDKLAFSLDGKSLMMEATDEHLLVSNDGGAKWQYLDGKNVRMPNVSPDGRYAIVQAPGYGPALVSFDAPTRTKPLGAPFLNDALFGDSSTSVALVRSDRTTASASKICIETLALPAAGAPKKLACMPTSQAGSWHMATPSRDGRLALISTIAKSKAVRLSVRSLVDGSEREAFDVPGDWEKYQWIDVMVSARGVVAYNAGDRPSPFSETPLKGDVVVLGGGVAKRVIPNARALGWIDDRELVTIDRTATGDPQGCGLVRVVSTMP